MEENKAKNTGNEKPAEHVVIHKWCCVFSQGAAAFVRWAARSQSLTVKWARG